MAGYYSVWRFSRTTLAILLATVCSAQLALGQYTFVQDTDGSGNWGDAANWLDGGSNTTTPNGVGVTVLFNQPVKSGVGGTTLTMPATDVTVGTFTIDNTNDDYLTKLTLAVPVGGGGRLIFEDSSGTAKFIETAGSADAAQNVQNSIQPPIWVKNTLEITEDNYPNLNTGTIFTNRFDGDFNSKIVKKGLAGIQFNLNTAPPLPSGQGFFGQIEIQQGAIRLINKPTFLSTVSGVTVSDGGQLQLADNAGTAVPEYTLGLESDSDPAVLNLNGVGTLAPSSGPQGALRFGITSPRTTTFKSPVFLQTDSVISVGASGSTGIIDKAITGPGGLTKQGDGKLTLTNAGVAYGGDTYILAAPTGSATSVLSLSFPVLPDTKDVHVAAATGAALDLNFAGIDTIRSLFLGITELSAGLYGKVGSADPTDNEVSWITGTGQLNVTGAVVGVPGDFNNNGSVDAGDYVLWRKGGPLANEVDTPNTVNGQDYTDWRARYGNPAGSGSGLGNTAIPEPATFVLLMLIAPFLAGRTLGRTR